MNNKLIPIVLTLVVGIILAGSVLMPVLNDATTTEKTFTNAGYFDARYIETDTDLTISWDYTNPTVITVGDNVVDLPTDASSNARRTVLASDNFILRYYLAPGPVFQYSDQLTTTYMSPVDEKNVTFEFSDGTMTFTFGTTVKTVSYTYLYVIDESGPYVMKESGEKAYMLGDSEFIGIGITSIGGSNKTLYINGSINDGATFSSWDTDLTFTDVAVNSNEVAGYNDLYQIDTITAKSGETDITYSYFLVPATVTAELTDHLTPGQIALLGAIPVLVIVALLVVAVGVVARRND